MLEGRLMNSTGWLVIVVTAYVVFLCAGGFFYDRYRKTNRRLARQNEIIYEETEGIEYGSDRRVSVKEEMDI
jgi:hypothetical protein